VKIELLLEMLDPLQTNSTFQMEQVQTRRENIFTLTKHVTKAVISQMEQVN
jgi:hypothetical protein